MICHISHVEHVFLPVIIAHHTARIDCLTSQPDVFFVSLPFSHLQHGHCIPDNGILFDLHNRYIYFSALMLSKPVNLYKKAAGDVCNVARCTAVYCC